MDVEIVAIGTELLLGQVVDTNSSFIGERLASIGINCHFQTRVGDNVPRIVDTFKRALERSDAVIACGGLGPTQDDVTRQALAEVMGVELLVDPAAKKLVEEVFASRSRPMSPSNLRQAEVPTGAELIPQRLGTAPGLICPVGSKVIYAVPGVPRELYEMMDRAVLPDLQARSGEHAVIVSRTLRSWGTSESALGELLAPHMDALDAQGPGAPTVAFLASGIEGIKVRVTVKRDTEEAARKVLDAEEKSLRAILGEVVFGVDDETMEYAIGQLLRGRKWSLAVAESFTGGLIASRIVSVPGASEWFKGGLVAYASEVKHSLLHVTEGPVVSAQAALEMAKGVSDLLGADIGLATTGVAGPTPQEGLEPGTAFGAIAFADGQSESVELHLSGGRSHIRDIGTINVLALLRQRLLGDRSVSS